MTAQGFLAFAGEAHRLRHCLSTLVPGRAAPPRLNRIFDSEDLVVFAPPGTEQIFLEEERGLVVGRLFRGVDPAMRVEALSLSESRHASWSQGRALLAGAWGNYVAFLRDRETITVVRDPSGALPVYHCNVDRVFAFFSDEDLARDLGLGARGIDEKFLCQWLTFPFLRTARTGLQRIKELLPGTSCTLEGDSLTVAIAWTPWTAASAAPAIDFDEAARSIRATALGTVKAQLTDRGPFILQLSGGLDSSIVAACLAAASLPFRAANFVTSLPDGDERDYARIVASALGVPLTEIGEDPRPLDLEPEPRPALRPSLSPVLQPLNRAFSAFARSTATSLFVTGAGGDNLFCYLTTAAPALDAAKTLGPRGALTVLHDVAELGGCTIWTAASFALRKFLATRPPWKRDERFLAPAAIAAEPDHHPWLDVPANALPGKIEHVVSIVRAQHFVEPEYPSGEAILHPLINQPLMELCLSIPTWWWLRGGRNRAVARAAFAGLLPEEVILRRTKGRLESMCARAYEANRETIASLLLDGEMKRRGLLDLSRLEPYLRAESPPRDDDYFRIFDFVSLELWLRSVGR